MCEEDYFQFIAIFLAAVAAECPVVLGHPHWQQSEWQQVSQIVQPELVFGKSLNSNRFSGLTRVEPRNLIMIPTGGTSGKIRFAIHNWQTLTASVKGFCQYFQLEKVNSFCILPLYHVSGLMQLMRVFLTQGKLYLSSYKNLKRSLPDCETHDYFISLVPTQLQWLLENHPSWLGTFQTVLLGGAAPWESLINSARKLLIPLAPTYGMTETASQVVTLHPQDFLAGNNSSGKPLPHVDLRINTQGVIQIKSPSLCLGYYPDYQPENQIFETDDVGYFDQDNYLYILGRNSQKIITGGENVFPTEVEKAILATKLVKDVAVIGVADEQWGEAIAAIYVPQEEISSAGMIQEALLTALAKYKHPKYWLAVEKLPRSPQGKLNQSFLIQLLDELGYKFSSG